MYPQTRVKEGRLPDCHREGGFRYPKILQASFKYGPMLISRRLRIENVTISQVDVVRHRHHHQQAPDPIRSFLQACRAAQSDLPYKMHPTRRATVVIDWAEKATIDGCSHLL